MRDVFSDDYWKRRLERAKSRGLLHETVYIVGFDRWIEYTQKELVPLFAKVVKPDDSVLDAGCGFGLLLDMVPTEWRGPYLGVDISESLLEEARTLHPGREFRQHDLRKPLQGRFDLGVLMCMRNMLRGAGAWDEVFSSVMSVCDSVVVIDPGCTPEVHTCQ